MDLKAYRYEFAESVPMDDVEAVLLLAISATQALHGESCTRLGCAHAFDEQQRACVIDANGEVSRSLNQLFVGFLRREFGDDGFTITRIRDDRPSTSPVGLGPNWN